MKRALLLLAFAACSPGTIGATADGDAPGGAGGAGAGRDGGAGAPLPGGGCPDDLEYFRTRVWEPILSRECVVCHVRDGLAGRSRLVLDPTSIEASLAAARAVAAVSEGGTSVLLLRPTGRHPAGHPGGAPVMLGSDLYRALETFVERVTAGRRCTEPPADTACIEIAPGKPRLRRLTRAEYDATVRALTGLASRWGEGLAADTVVRGFDNHAASLAVTPLLADQLRRAAEEIAAAVRLEAVLPCQPGAPGCAEAFVDAFGRRAFRRPLAPAERQRYLALMALEPEPEAAVRLAVSAFLQSPAFLYRSELGTPRADGARDLDAWEIASQLSYLLWGTMPDDALLAAAGSGALLAGDEIARQARRLLDDPRSDAALDRFASQWLGLDRLDTVPKDAEAFPGLDGALRASMREEARRFVADVIRGGGSLADLLAARHTFVDESLARFYGLGAAGRVEREQASGLLTLGAVLTVHAFPGSSSPIHRGKLVRERFLCQDLPPPPPNLGVMPPPVDPTRSTRERYAAHASVEPCVSCHRLMDPIGYAFEHFDGAGRFRATEAGRPVDATGEIAGSAASDGTFTGAPGLGAHLGRSTEAGACFARQWVRFAFGVDEREELGCLAASLGEGALTMPVLELLVALTRASHVRTRLGAVPPPTPPGSGGPEAPLPDAGAPPPPPDAAPTMGDLAVEVVVDSRWDGGHCDSVRVTNRSAAAVRWRITLSIDGTLTDVWNATATPAGAETAFTGAGWNDTVEPGATASFGYCARL